MFWEVWRNVTSATTNWSLGGGSGNSGGAKKGLPSSSSSSAHKTRYNRLTGPTKSQSQPANLTSLQDFSSSSESLSGTGTNQPIHPLPLVVEDEKPSRDLSLESHIPPITSDTCTSARKPTSKKNGMKQSFSSFFPFTSCATPSSPPPGTSSSTSHPAGNETESSWDQDTTDTKKDIGRGVYPDEDDISDLDDEVEHLTCDVCERAFPTLKFLARHQRKKRHYGCLQCDSIFPSREVLECHREQMCHYDYAIDVYDEDGDEENFFESDDDEHGISDDEERERLL